LRYGPGAPPRAAADESAWERPMNENLSLIVMCLFLLASLAFLAEQLTSYH
jgi:hypothetical protein